MPSDCVAIVGNICASHFWFGGVWPWQCSSAPCVYRAGASTISWRVVQFLRRLEGVWKHLRGNGENPPSDNFRENTLEETAGSVLSSIYGFALKTSIVSHTLCLPERLLLNAGPLVGCFAMFCYLESCTFLLFFVNENHGSKTWHFSDMSQLCPSFRFEGYLTCLQLKSFFNTGVGGYVTVNLSWAAVAPDSSKPLDEVITATLPEARSCRGSRNQHVTAIATLHTKDYIGAITLATLLRLTDRNRRDKLAVPAASCCYFS